MNFILDRYLDLYKNLNLCKNRDTFFRQNNVIRWKSNTLKSFLLRNSHFKKCQNNTSCQETKILWVSKLTCTSQHNSALYHTCYTCTLYFLPSKLISTHCKINVERLNSFESELFFLSCSTNNSRQVNFKCFHENDISVFLINTE